MTCQGGKYDTAEALDDLTARRAEVGGEATEPGAPSAPFMEHSRVCDAKVGWGILIPSSLRTPRGVRVYPGRGCCFFLRLSCTWHGSTCGGGRMNGTKSFLSWSGRSRGGDRHSQGSK